ncbi:MAG: DNA-binding protein [Bacteroidota bacterium]
MKDWHAVKEVSGLLNISVQAVRQRAVRNGWRSREVASPGGGKPALEYHVDSLPKEARVALQMRDAARDAEAHAEALFARRLAEQAELRRKTDQLRDLAQLPSKARAKAEAKLWALDAWQRFATDADLTAQKSATLFADVVTHGDIEVPSEHAAHLQRISARSLFRWKKTAETDGPAALGGRYGKRSARTYEAAIEEDNALGLYVLGQLGQRGRQVTARILKKGADALHAEGHLPEPPSVKTFERFLAWLQEERPVRWAHLVEPHKARGKVMPAFGSRSDHLTRINELWELDSTLADVLLEEETTDGPKLVRYNLLACVDVYTRRTMFLVSKRSRAEAIGALVRKCLLEWGVPEGVKMDNGKDYRSLYLDQVFGALKVARAFCKPYSPHEKPFVERVIGTFQHGMFSLLPGYLGASVSDRKGLDARRRRTAGGEPPLELGEVHKSVHEFAAFADEWAAYHYANAEHSALGKSPLAKSLEKGQRTQRIPDARALDVLLAPPVGGRKGRFTVQKKGIQYQPEHLRGRFFFIAPELAGLVGRTVQCREDLGDVGRLYVFSEAGAFICIAENPRLTGISQEEVARVANRNIREIRKEMRKVEQQAVREFPAERVLRAIREQGLEDAGKLAGRIGPADDYVTPALEEAARAAQAKANLNTPTTATGASDAEREAGEALLRAAADRRRREEEAQAQRDADGAAVLHRLTATKTLYASDDDKYLALVEMQGRGETLTPADLAFVQRYESAALGGRGAASSAG